MFAIIRYCKFHGSLKCPIVWRWIVFCRDPSYEISQSEGRASACQLHQSNSIKFDSIPFGYCTSWLSDHFSFLDFMFPSVCGLQYVLTITVTKKTSSLGLERVPSHSHSHFHPTHFNPSRQGAIGEIAPAPVHPPRLRKSAAGVSVLAFRTWGGANRVRSLTSGPLGVAPCPYSPYSQKNPEKSSDTIEF